ncbi:hypothetical protein [Thalassovita sp.]|uniref:hypothetical protein n=1 Tax=Thalassovita sp. TaxID=1979401 RepID=UPI0029DE8BDC|nr:hypothetical protein [Thalassovita sp.]
MSRNDWHILHEEGALIVARSLPVRFDLSVETVLPFCGKVRLARQIRQDMWRALQRIRGFSPAVRVAEEQGGLRVTAGGRMEHAYPRRLAEEKLRNLMLDGNNRARWVACAGGFCYA